MFNLIRTLAVLAILIFSTNLFALGTIDLPPEDSGISVEQFYVDTDGGGIEGKLYLTVFTPNIAGNLPTLILCPGSTEPASNWDFYFPPFTPLFLAERGFKVVLWDPRGTFTLPFLGTGDVLSISTYFDPERYAIGQSSLFPPAILMLSEFFVDDLEKVIEHTYEKLPLVDKNNIGIIGFSHGATYPLIEQAIYNDNRVKLIFAIEPMGDEASLVDMAAGPVPVIGNVAVNTAKRIPETVYDRILWEPLNNGLGIVGVATKYGDRVSCPVYIIQCERYHASSSGIMGIGECTSPGLSIYESLTITPFKKFNNEPPNISVDEINDFFPNTIWDNGELLVEYFIDNIEPQLK
jgi:pimeloyl-ACP methyl ester carboxylesterase